jgi:hypothetical protein
MKSKLTTSLSKTIFYFISLFFFSISTFGQAPEWEWVQQPIGTNHETSNSMIADANGNIYITGYFNSLTISFGDFALANAGKSAGYTDFFIAKYDSSGKCLWAKSAGGSGDDAGNSIAVDAKGNSYVTGSFRSPTIDFGKTTLTNAKDGGDEDVFVAKYDNSGKLLWAKSAGGNDRDIGNGIAVDANGNCFVTGSFKSTAMTFDDTKLATAGYSDAFVAAYDPKGNLLWAKSGKGTGDEVGKSVGVDSKGNCYVFGFFTSNTISFGSKILTLAQESMYGTKDIFEVKYDAKGTVSWAISAGGSGDEGNYGNYGGMRVDVNGNSYFASVSTSAVVSYMYASGATTVKNTSTSGFIVAKYDADGKYVWSRNFGGKKADECRDICIDKSGNFYITGNFNSDSLMIGTQKLKNKTTRRLGDVFIAKFDADGKVLWAKNSEVISFGGSQSVAADDSGNCYVTGYFYSSIKFGKFTLTNTGETGMGDIFIAKLK